MKMDKLLAVGRKLGYTGAELQELVAKEQKMMCNDRARSCGLEILSP